MSLTRGTWWSWPATRAAWDESCGLAPPCCGRGTWARRRTLRSGSRWASWTPGGSTWEWPAWRDRPGTCMKESNEIINRPHRRDWAVTLVHTVLTVHRWGSALKLFTLIQSPVTGADMPVINTCRAELGVCCGEIQTNFGTCSWVVRSCWAHSCWYENQHEAAAVRRALTVQVRYEYQRMLNTREKARRNF